MSCATAEDLLKGSAAADRRRLFLLRRRGAAALGRGGADLGCLGGRGRCRSGRNRARFGLGLFLLLLGLGLFLLLSFFSSTLGASAAAAAADALATSAVASSFLSPEKAKPAIATSRSAATPPPMSKVLLLFGAGMLRGIEPDETFMSVEREGGGSGGAGAVSSAWFAFSENSGLPRRRCSSSRSTHPCRTDHCWTAPPRLLARGRARLGRSALLRGLCGAACLQRVEREQHGVLVARAGELTVVVRGGACLGQAPGPTAGALVATSSSSLPAVATPPKRSTAPAERPPASLAGSALAAAGP